MTDEAYVFPVSFAQQRLWFLDRMAPGNPFYNIPLAIPIRAPLDVGALERALNAVVARHESLRTTFRMLDGEPCQVVHPSLSVPVAITDLRSEPKTRRAARTIELATQEARRPFDLEAGPLLRCGVLICGPLDHVLLLSLHHIVSDGWSMGILVREVTALYQGYLGGRPVQLPDLPIQYADFAVWQRDWLQGDVLARQLDYWRHQLADLPMLDLPCNRPRPAVLTYQGSFVPIALSPALARQVRAFARSHSATPFMVLITGFALLLHRYTGQNDIVMGTPVANRNRSEIEELIGFFVNSLVLRIDLSGDPGFAELLARVHELALQAYAHQDVPFEKLVEQLHPARDPSRNPLFQVTLQLVNAPTLQGVAAQGSGGPTIPVQRGAAIFDLALTLLEGPSDFTGIIEYSTDLFDAATIERMECHFERILAHGMGHPQLGASRIPLLSMAETAAALRLSRGPFLAAPDDPFMHRAIARQAQLTPDAVAVRTDAGELSYRDLVGAAKRLAARLRALHVGPDTRVAVLMDRSAQLVVALLAVLEAGGAYVPFDPTYPTDRLRFMRADAAVGVVLADNLRSELAVSVADCRAAVLLVDGEPDEDPSLELDMPGAPSPDDLAYVLYTSGSTGSPKGVAITHRALANHMAWMLDRFELTPQDRVLQRTLASFDASVWEFFAPLIAGAQLVLLPLEAQKSPELIVECIAERGITVAQFVPSLLQVMLEVPRFFTCTALRRIYCGGEALPDELRAKIEDSLAVELVNLYGPTEATIDATFYVCGGAPEQFGVPIGEPLANLSAYVLDAELQPVPDGVGGELHLAGVGLARGYIRRPALTAERFVPDPYSAEPGGRMYRTGDGVRRTSNGRLLYLGRVDEQVKLRGYRIELGEVEAAIRNVPGVQRCAVVAPQEPLGPAGLVAYIVPSAREAAEVGTEDAGAEHVSTWEGVYEEVYSGLPPEPNGSANFIGWNSSYTGLPIPAPEMNEWLESTLERIRALRPLRVLEIGCGTGLLLTRLAPDCEHYTGADFSRAALRYLRRAIRALPGHGANVELLHRRADQLIDMPPGSFDTVILNSVIQYFPSIDYLMTVLRAVAPAVSANGAIFIGDVRSLPLLAAFQLSKALHRMPNDADAQSVVNQLHAATDEEQELVIDPGFFISVAPELGALGGARIHLKSGCHDNELTRFRYDVVVSMAAEPEVSSQRFDWTRDGFDLERLDALISEAQFDRCVVEGVPNTRVWLESGLLDNLACAPPHRAVAELLAEQRRQAAVAVAPHDVWTSAAGRCDVQLTFSKPPRDGCFDILLAKRGVGLPAASAPRQGDAAGASSGRPYANNPMRSAIARQLGTRIREVLTAQLPQHMVPSAFVLLNEIPLLPNGKLDRKALPAHRPLRGDDRAHVAPRTALEQALATEWAEVLDLPRVSIRDDFFTVLGGHSLLATRLISRIREALLIEVPLKQIFQSPTVEQFAVALIEGSFDGGKDVEDKAALLVRLAQMSEAELDIALHSERHAPV